MIDLAISFPSIMVPVLLTLCGILYVTFRRPTGAWDLGGAIAILVWLAAIGTAWAMWLLLWVLQ